MKKKIIRTKKAKSLKTNKRKKRNKDVDLWKEIRTNLKPLSNAYQKFKEKRKIEKEKYEEKKLRDEEKQRVKDEENTKLKEEENRRLKKEKKLKEDEEKKLKIQEDQKIEEQRIKDERMEKIRKEEIYKERLLIGEKARLQQLETVRKLREEENRVIEERGKKISIQSNSEEILKEEDQRLKREELRLKQEEQNLKRKELRLKEEEQNLKEKEKLLKSNQKLNDNINKNKLSGTVKWFNEEKSYGFIEEDINKKEIFVNSLSVKNSNLESLKEGEKLLFEVEETDKGPSAKNLQKISEDINPHLRIVK